MKNHPKAREFCLQFLYHFQLPVFEPERKLTSKEFDSVEIFSRMESFKNTLNIEIDSAEQAYLATIIKGLFMNFDEIEALITKYAKNWKISRISKIEHTLLLMSVYELKYHPEISFKLVMNEAIDLAKKYSSVDAGSFVNGILDSIYKNEIANA
jgi:transcription antitermination factor NusB